MAQLPPDHTQYYLGLYFGLGLASIGVQLARSFALVAGTVTASRQLHQQLLDKVLRLPMSFFNTQPTGEPLVGSKGVGGRVPVSCCYKGGVVGELVGGSCGWVT
jgi:hypothetical protein